MNNEIVRFRDSDPDGMGQYDVVVDAKFRYPLSKKQQAVLRNIADSYDYDPGYETLENFAEAVLNDACKTKEFKNDGQRWKFVQPDIVLEIEV